MRITRTKKFSTFTSSWSVRSLWSPTLWAKSGYVKTMKPTATSGCLAGPNSVLRNLLFSLRSSHTVPCASCVPSMVSLYGGLCGLSCLVFLSLWDVRSFWFHHHNVGSQLDIRLDLTPWLSMVGLTQGHLLFLSY